MAVINMKYLYHEISVNANVNEVFNTWVTKEGLESFFAPKCSVDPKIDGLFEILFDLDAEPGSRGAENQRVMAFEKDKMISFSWNNPPAFPEIQMQRTLVTLKFHSLGTGRTLIQFCQTGWGDGQHWDKALEYFNKAWKKVVFPRLEWRFENGPIDWSNPPKF
ncbi:MAG: SRPBCC domain-containing protein [Ignavibacteriae bacterium HGW-Ignavibacteriae-2]|jgi:uncharacterized protein YndB with AHSA1/START domain|nr:SRPBCC domain-containing protein [Bacteroidota bacterium]PKL88655.1 MAG: SRPBCC domain-containing protein [Ignavibacteriae bacterium HGW-Ignavibacteriae-2]